MSISQPSSKPPIACTLTGADFQVRSDDVAAMFASAERVEERPDGFAFRFSGAGDVARRVLEFVTEERECCPFLTFELTFEPGHGPVWLRLGGDEDVKAFIAQTFVVAADGVQGAEP